MPFVELRAPQRSCQIQAVINGPARSGDDVVNGHVAERETLRDILCITETRLDLSDFPMPSKIDIFERPDDPELRAFGRTSNRCIVVLV